jgi:ribosomal protein S18 acetylase RimI-like enzyme
MDTENSVWIRQVTLNDLDACTEIESLCFGPYAASRQRIHKRISDYPQGFLVAERDDQVLGFVNSGALHHEDISDDALKELIGHDPDGLNTVIFALAVHPQYQKQGISVGLMEGFIQRASELGKTAVLLMCKESLIPYYERYGFRDLGASQSSYGGARWHEMRLTLTERR